MNSKFLQEKFKELEDENYELKIFKKNQEGMPMVDNENDKEILCGNQSTVSLKHYDQLLCDLRCPGCHSRLQAPIYICMSGHSICRICRVSLRACPVCESELSNIRSCTLERLAGKFQFPCKNLRNGCVVRMPLELMKWHEEKCIYKKTSCFMGKIWHDCNWRGCESKWIEHCKQKHSQKILEKHESFDLVWNFESLKDNAGPIIAFYIIQNYGETFNLYQIHEAKQSSLTWTIILANHKISEVSNHNAVIKLPRFCFEFEFYNKQDPSYLLIQRFPIHYEDSEDVLDDGRCMKISLHDVERFLDENQNLFYRVKILSGCFKQNRSNEVIDDMNHQQQESVVKTDDFLYFDSEIETERISEKRVQDDWIKQIFAKEFNDKTRSDEQAKLIPKPPRKSLENRKSLERNVNIDSYNDLKLGD